jgi:hypothetical protein
MNSCAATRSAAETNEIPGAVVGPRESADAPIEPQQRLYFLPLPLPQG